MLGHVGLYVITIVGSVGSRCQAITMCACLADHIRPWSKECTMCYDAHSCLLTCL